jgi:LacI family transcriptional regulator
MDEKSKFGATIGGRRPLIADVARAAGLSTATVDRVLNRRRGVREMTVGRVLSAAVEVGYLSEHDLASIRRPKPLRVVFLLPTGTNPYLRLLGAKVRDLAERAPAPANARVRCFFIESFNPPAVADALKRLGKRADGIAFMAIDHPLVREATENLITAGKMVVTIVSDLTSSRRLAYVGLDNLAAGRTAAYLLGRFARRNEGSVALIAASRIYRAHQAREMGFLGLAEEMFPGVKVVGLREGHDDSAENYRHTMSLLNQYNDLIGIYNVGGSSAGIARALRESGRKADIVFIGHGLTPDTRALLVEQAMDAVITQNPDIIIANSLRAFSREGGESLTLNVPMEIYFRENLPMEV